MTDPMSVLPNCKFPVIVPDCQRNAVCSSCCPFFQPVEFIPQHFLLQTVRSRAFCLQVYIMQMINKISPLLNYEVHHIGNKSSEMEESFPYCHTLKVHNSICSFIPQVVSSHTVFLSGSSSSSSSSSSSEGKVRPRTGLEGPEGEQRCTSALSLTSALDGHSQIAVANGNCVPCEVRTASLYSYCNAKSEFKTDCFKFEVFWPSFLLHRLLSSYTAVSRRTSGRSL